MADLRQDLRRTQQAEQRKFEQRGAAMRKQATQSPLGAAKPAPRRSAPTAKSAPMPAAPAPVAPRGRAASAPGMTQVEQLRRQAMPSTTTSTTVPGGANISPQDMQRMDELAQQPATRTIYVPGVGSVTVNQ